MCVCTCADTGTAPARATVAGLIPNVDVCFAEATCRLVGSRTITLTSSGVGASPAKAAGVDVDADGRALILGCRESDRAQRERRAGMRQQSSGCAVGRHPGSHRRRRLDRRDVLALRERANALPSDLDLDRSACARSIRAGPRSNAQQVVRLALAEDLRESVRQGAFVFTTVRPPVRSGRIRSDSWVRSISLRAPVSCCRRMAGPLVRR